MKQLLKVLGSVFRKLTKLLISHFAKISVYTYRTSIQNSKDVESTFLCHGILDQKQLNELSSTVLCSCIVSFMYVICTDCTSVRTTATE